MAAGIQMIPSSVSGIESLWSSSHVSSYACVCVCVYKCLCVCAAPALCVCVYVCLTRNSSFSVFVSFCLFLSVFLCSSLSVSLSPDVSPHLALFSLSYQFCFLLFKLHSHIGLFHMVVDGPLKFRASMLTETWSIMEISISQKSKQTSKTDSS